MSAPYYADAHVQLYLGDFRDVLPTLTVTPDLVLADPPYGETSLDWDTWPDGWPTLMPGRSLWCFGSIRRAIGIEKRESQCERAALYRLSQGVLPFSEAL